MILTAHQPAYLPWLGYFHKIAISDKFVILDNVQFEKNSFINRNRIKTPCGSIWITVPLKMKGHITKTISCMEIDNSFKWRDKHWKSIYLNYKKAPYFNRYADFFQEIYGMEWDNLADFTTFMLKFFVKEIGIKTEIYKQSSLQISSKREELISNLCNKLDQQIFIFGKLGKDYVDEDYFKKQNIKLYFQDYNHPEYEQLWNEFVPNLSIIDLMFNVKQDDLLNIIMNDNVVKQDVVKLLQNIDDVTKK